LTGVEAMKMFKVIVFKCYENFIKIGGLTSEQSVEPRSRRKQ